MEDPAHWGDGRPSGGRPSQTVHQPAAAPSGIRPSCVMKLS